jgi:hypothetical protein
LDRGAGLVWRAIRVRASWFGEQSGLGRLGLESSQG